MQRTISHLLGNIIGATDGEIGKVEDFYFDDETWTVRYLIVNTGSWLSGRKVLISPQALQAETWDAGVFPVNLSKEQVKNSPEINTELPVSRLMEGQLAQYYPWQSYWGQGFYPNGVWGIVSGTPRMDPQIIENLESSKVSEQDTHLRSTQLVKGYHIHASNGDIGHVSDFIIDDKTWQISFLVVDTHNWIGGKKVLVGVKYISKISWEDSEVYVKLNIETIKDSAAIDTADYTMPKGDKSEYHEQVFASEVTKGKK